MKRVVPILGPGQGRVDLVKDMNGNLILQFGDQGARMTPRGAYDFAMAILRNLGIDVHETHQRSDDLGGQPLKATLKLLG